MSSRKLDLMAAIALPRFLAFEAALEKEGIPFVRACTYRSPAEQDALFKQGRSEYGLIVTWARGGQSPHNFEIDGQPASMAADYYPLHHGKLAGIGSFAERHLWLVMINCAMSVGLECGGLWPGPKVDRPHFQMPKELWKNVQDK